MMATWNLKRWGGALALIAYSFQLLVALGHVHADEVFGPLGHAVEFGGAGEQAVTPEDKPGNPLHRQHQADAADACSICAVVHLASAGILPDAARLMAPTARHVALSLSGPSFRLTRAPYLLSRTRAPPSLSL